MESDEVCSDTSCCFEVLAYHQNLYDCAKKRLDDYIADHSEIYQLRYTLSKKRIAGYKYNYQLEEFMQNFTTYHMFIKFSDDATHMNIFSRKPMRDDDFKMPDILNDSSSDEDF